MLKIKEQDESLNEERLKKKRMKRLRTKIITTKILRRGKLTITNNRKKRCCEWNMRRKRNKATIEEHEELSRL